MKSPPITQLLAVPDVDNRSELAPDLLCATGRKALDPVSIDRADLRLQGATL